MFCQEFLVVVVVVVAAAIYNREFAQNYEICCPDDLLFVSFVVLISIFTKIGFVCC